MEALKLILCGAGTMGRHHLRIARADRAVRMVAIVDPALAGGTLDGVPVVSHVSEVGCAVDAAIVATPTFTHQAVVLDLVARGIPLLVEKPLASTPAECELIAKRAGSVKVAIGHVERFNPAVRAIGSLGTVRHVELTRVGTSRRCDVLLELAVHDSDLLERFAGRASLRTADVRSSFGDDIIDSADLSLVTATGATATIRASVAGERMRRVRIECTRGLVELDLLERTAKVDGRPIPAPSEDALAAQLTAFRAFLDGRSSDVCRIEEASRSVELSDAARRTATPRFAEAAP